MTPTEATKALEIKDLSYIYRGDWLLQKIPALKRVSLDVMRGEAFGFLGHNGAGKTTAIKCILDLIKPSTGEIKIFGERSIKTSSRKLIGYLPEQPYFYDHLSVEETLAFYGRLAGLGKAELPDAVSRVLEQLQLASRRKQRMRSLSKGLTQRVALAQALVANPRLLILDEPFSGLDPLGRRRFRELLLQLKTAGCTLFMSSHILSDVEQICDRASVLVQGELKGVINLQDLKSGGEQSSGALEGYFMKLVESEHVE